MKIKFTRQFFVFFVGSLIFLNYFAVDLNCSEGKHHNKTWLTDERKLAVKHAAKVIPVACGFFYAYKTSTICLHELSHAAVSMLTGNKTSIHISPWIFCEQQYILTSCPPNTVNHILICLAGPLGGILTSFAWAPLLKTFLQRTAIESSKKEEWKSLFEKRSSMALSFIGAACDRTY